MLRRPFLPLCLIFTLLLTVGCSDSTTAAPTKAEVTVDPNVYSVDHPELFKLVTVDARDLPTVLTANGSITPDVNRAIHLTSQGSGRVIDLRVKLGDNVTKGEVLLSIYSGDLSAAFSDYQKSLADESLAQKGLERAQLLFSHGALAQKDLDTAVDTEQKAKVDVQTGEHRIRVLGGDPAHPNSVIELRSPINGTIVEQNVSAFEGIKSLDNSPNLFTIADLSEVWVLCDVFENDLALVAVGDPVEITLNAYPGRIYKGTVGDISRVLDPTLRSAKVRIVLQNADGSLRPNMYAVATFRSRKLQSHLVIPAPAIMRLQDKDWVFRKEGENKFRKLEVRSNGVMSGGLQELQDGPLKSGDQIVANALEFSSAVAESK